MTRIVTYTKSTGRAALRLSGEAFYKAFGTGGSDMFLYHIRHTNKDEWETGAGHLSDAGTLVRDTVIASSVSGTVDFSPGGKIVVNI